jgi:hypothetical protein
MALLGLPPDEIRSSQTLHAAMLSLAKLDPRVALSILRGDARLTPQLYEMRGPFYATEAGATLELSYDQHHVATAFICCDISYSFKTAEGEPIVEHGIDALLRVVGGYYMQWIFSPTPEPIQNIARPSKYVPFLLRFPQEIRTSLVLTKPCPPKAQIAIMFHGLDVESRALHDNVSLTEARMRLALEYDVGIGDQDEDVSP